VMSRTTKKRQVRAQVHGAAELRSVNLFEFLGESMLRKIEDAPIEVRLIFADGERTFQLQKGDPWHKTLSQRRAEALRQSLRRALNPQEADTK
jgi:hypothetical protein